MGAESVSNLGILPFVPAEQERGLALPDCILLVRSFCRVMSYVLVKNLDSGTVVTVK